MTLGDKAKALVGGFIVAAVAWGANYITNRFGIEIPADAVMGAGQWIADIAVTALFGFIGGWAIWRVPNTPSA